MLGLEICRVLVGRLQLEVEEREKGVGVESPLGKTGSQALVRHLDV